MNLLRQRANQLVSGSPVGVKTGQLRASLYLKKESDLKYTLGFRADYAKYPINRTSFKQQLQAYYKTLF